MELAELEQWLDGAEGTLGSFRVTPEDLKQFEQRVREHRVMLLQEMRETAVGCEDDIVCGEVMKEGVYVVGLSHFVVAQIASR